MEKTGCHASLSIKSSQGKPFLRHPVRYNRDDFIRLGRIIGLQVESKIMGTIHACMHHKDRGLNGGAFAGLEYHRTDGQAGRSAPFPYFDVRLFPESQRPTPGIRHFNRKRQVCI